MEFIKLYLYVTVGSKILGFVLIPFIVIYTLNTFLNLEIAVNIKNWLAIWCLLFLHMFLTRTAVYWRSNG